MLYGVPTVNQVSAAWNTIARFDDYTAARRAVRWLFDEGYPVEQLDIVGSDLQLVERVTGRRQTGRAAAGWALSGMWAGLLIGLFCGLFTSGHTWLVVLAASAGLGALWGAVLGFATHRGTREFSSSCGLSAARYDLIARGGGAERARDLLGQAGLLPPAQPGTTT